MGLILSSMYSSAPKYPTNEMQSQQLRLRLDFYTHNIMIYAGEILLPY